jgi:signal transduction histidine kinase
MKTYHILSKIKFLKKYSFKFLFVAFLGIHIPLIGLIIYLALGGAENLSPLSVIISVLIFTLLATGITLFILNKLLYPILFAKESLNNYIANNELPNMPTHYTDEVGVLLSEIQFSIKTLDDLLKEKKDLIGLMSHDLKNPLTAIVNYTELIKMDEKYSDIADKINIAAKTQQTIIDSVLELLENETIVITNDMKEEIDIQQTIDHILQQYEMRNSAKNNVFETQINSKNLIANKNLLSQVIANLISNSVKFTENGKITIKAEDAADYVKIVVQDTGIGFNPDNASRLFDRFTKEKRKGTNNEPTTGLGLYLCKKIIERHFGFIDAYSEGNGKGSTFEILLPKKVN